MPVVQYQKYCQSLVEDEKKYILESEEAKVQFDKQILELKASVEIEVAKEMNSEITKYKPLSDSLIESANSEVKTAEDHIKTIEDQKKTAEDQIAEIQKNPKKKTHSLLVQLQGEVEKYKKQLIDRNARLEIGKSKLVIAEKLKNRENKYLPLYTRFVDEKTNLGNYMYIRVALIACCKSLLEVKLKSLYDIFNKDDFKEAIKYTDLVRLLHTAVYCMNKLECVTSIPTNDQLNGIAFSGFNQYEISPTQGRMMYYQFEEWLLGVIRRSKGLSDFFWITWEFDKYSDLQMKMMSCIHKYEIGLLSANTMKYLLQKDSNKYWPQLDSENKGVIHEKSMEYGANDPTKPDYSKYLARQVKKKSSSNAIPLLHDCYSNEVFARYELKEECAIKIQACYRGFLGKKIGEKLARNKAFYEAEDKSKKIIAEEIEKEFYEKSTQGGTDGLKWNAKVRLMQVQYRARRIHISRSQVIEIMKAEERKKAYEEVEKKYNEMAIEQGIPARYRKPPNKLIEHVLDDLAASGDVEQKAIDEVIKKQLDYEPIKFNSKRVEEAPEDEKKEGEEKKEDDKNEEKKEVVEEKKDIEEDDIGEIKPLVINPIQTIPQDAASPKRRSVMRSSRRRSFLPTKPLANEDKKKKSAFLKQEDEKNIQPENELDRKFDEAARKQHLLVGLHPDDLFKLGESNDEKRYKLLLNQPFLTTTQLLHRLKQMCNSVTRLKAHEFLLELPSKQLILRKIKSYETTEQLSQYISEHFGFSEKTSDELALCLYGMYKNDFYTGIINNRINLIAKSREELLYQMKSNQVKELYNIIQVDDQQQQNALSIEGGGISEKEIKFRERKIEDEQKTAITDIQNTITTTKDHMSLSISRLHNLECKVQQMKKRLQLLQAYHEEQAEIRNNTKDVKKDDRYFQQSMKDFVRNPNSSDRIEWTQRLYTAIDLAEDNDEQSMKKYQEIQGVIEDFITCAVTYGEIIIREMSVPDSEKTIKPIATRKCDWDGNVKPFYEVANIRYKFAFDYDGMFNGSDENAAKYMRQGVKGNQQIFKCRTAGIRLPLQLNIDYLGFRLEATSVIPIEGIPTGSLSERIIHSELLIGTKDRGNKIVLGDQFLAGKLFAIAKKLNLKDHIVKGIHDLTIKHIPLSADLEGYKGIDNEYYLLNFNRLLPPEDPYETPHLPLQPRGVSIFWRFLRPELVGVYIYYFIYYYL